MCLLRQSYVPRSTGGGSGTAPNIRSDTPCPQGTMPRRRRCIRRQSMSAGSSPTPCKRRCCAPRSTSTRASLPGTSRRQRTWTRPQKRTARSWARSTRTAPRTCRRSRECPRCLAPLPSRGTGSCRSCRQSRATPPPSTSARSTRSAPCTCVPAAVGHGCDSKVGENARWARRKQGGRGARRHAVAELAGRDGQGVRPTAAAYRSPQSCMSYHGRAI